jgi:hypothetical protein
MEIRLLFLDTQKITDTLMTLSIKEDQYDFPGFSLFDPFITWTSDIDFI